MECHRICSEAAKVPMLCVQVCMQDAGPTECFGVAHACLFELHAAAQLVTATISPVVMPSVHTTLLSMHFGESYDSLDKPHCLLLQPPVAGV